MWEDSPFGERSIFHPSHYNTKALSIKYIGSKKINEYTYVYFNVVTKNLINTKATIVVKELEIILDEVVASKAIDIPRSGSLKVELKFKEENLSKTILEGEFEFKASITCDGLSAESDEFSLKLEMIGETKNVKDAANKESNQKEKSNIEKEEDFKVCPIDIEHRSHFVLHCTAGNMSLQAIKNHTKYDTPSRSKSLAHAYVMKDGTILKIWSLSQKDVWATKMEKYNKELIGQMFHIELNYGSPDSPTEEQYNTVADLYIEASKIEKCWPIIVPHIEVDRGLADGHQDPLDFNYNFLYEKLKEKGVPINDIPKFDHVRYWGDKSYKTPWASDKNSWPPLLTGNPHKK